MFPKVFTLKFPEIDLQQPEKEMSLDIFIYDGEMDMTSTIGISLPIYLKKLTFELHITYSNLENVQFASTLFKDKNKFIIKEVLPTSS